MTLTKGQINKIAVQILERRYAIVWLQGNTRNVKGRKFTGRKGVPDIIGFMSTTGVFVGCEVKTIGDTMSDEQHEFLQELTNAGGIALVAIEDKHTGNVRLITYNDYRQNNFRTDRAGGKC